MLYFYCTYVNCYSAKLYIYNMEKIINTYVLKSKTILYLLCNLKSYNYINCQIHELRLKLHIYDKFGYI